MSDSNKKTILEEAIETVDDRMQQYGPPTDNHNAIALLWEVYLGAKGIEAEITARDVNLMMVLVKIARDCFSAKRDNLVDIAGYARCAEIVSDEKERGDKLVEELGAIEREAREQERLAQEKMGGSSESEEQLQQIEEDKLVCKCGHPRWQHEDVDAYCLGTRCACSCFTAVAPAIPDPEIKARAEAAKEPRMEKYGSPAATLWQPPATGDVQQLKERGSKTMVDFLGTKIDLISDPAVPPELGVVILPRTDLPYPPPYQLPPDGSRWKHRRDFFHYVDRTRFFDNNWEVLLANEDGISAGKCTLRYFWENYTRAEHPQSAGAQIFERQPGPPQFAPTPRGGSEDSIEWKRVIPPREEHTSGLINHFPAMTVDNKPCVRCGSILLNSGECINCDETPMVPVKPASGHVETQPCVPFDTCPICLKRVQEMRAEGRAAETPTEKLPKPDIQKLLREVDEERARRLEERLKEQGEQLDQQTALLKCDNCAYSTADENFATNHVWNNPGHVIGNMGARKVKDSHGNSSYLPPKK